MNRTVACTRVTSPYNSCDLTIAASCGSESECNDGADNDCDEKSDCADTDCSTKCCIGTISLSLSPNPADPSTSATSISVTATASGLSKCEGKTVYFRDGSCSGTIAATCNIGVIGTGCSATFKAPEVGTGSKTYYACIDKNGDGIFD